MKYPALLLFFWLAIFSKNTALADSPITSTDFSSAYSTESIVQYAGTVNGILDKKLMKYLANSKNPISLKLAVINKLSWNTDGENNAALYFEFLQKKKKLADENEFLKKGSAEDLICYAYLLAMDNYFDVTRAAEFADKAVKLNEKSYAIQIIHALITAQVHFDGDWCLIYRVCDKVRKNQTLEHDFSAKANAIIFEYIELYKEYCKPKKAP